MGGNYTVAFGSVLSLRKQWTALRAWCFATVPMFQSDHFEVESGVASATVDEVHSMKSLGIASLCAVARLVAKPVLATNVPQLCLESVRATLSYNTGVALGEGLVQRAWQSVSECSRLDEFANIGRLSELIGGLAEPDQIVARPVNTYGAFSDCCVSRFRATSRELCGAYTACAEDPLVPFREVWEESLAIQRNVQ